MGVVTSTSLEYFNGLKEHLQDSRHKQDYEKFLKKISKVYHTANPVNRFMAGPLVELLLRQMLEKAFRNEQFERCADEKKYVDINLPNNISWSVKSTFCADGYFRLTNTMGHSDKSADLWRVPTIFFLPGTGIVYADPRRHMTSPRPKVDDDCVKILKSSVREHATNKMYVIDFDVPFLSPAGPSINHVEQVFEAWGGNDLP